MGVEEFMPQNEMNLTTNSWGALQQPAHSSRSLHASFRALLAAIDQGWQVNQPVQALPSTRFENWTYHFVLTDPASQGAFRLFVPATPVVQRFIERNNFNVIEGGTY
jgi:hypothetical protein